MPDFEYIAINEAGEKIQSEITAPSEREVILHLQKMQLTPVEIKPAGAKKTYRGINRKIRIKEVILFTKQLHTLLKAGVPILVSLKAIRDQNTDPSFQAMVEKIAAEVEAGNSLSTALGLFPKVFPPIYLNSIKVGEVSGTLEEALQYMYVYLEEDDRMKKDIKKALRYPALVVLGILVAFLIFTVYVIPNFIPIFSASGVTLPLPTRLLIGAYHVLSNYGLLIGLGIILLVVANVFYYRTEKGRFKYHRLFLQIPIFGSLLQKSNISRFAKTFYTMNRTGIPLMKAFETLQNTMENEVYRREIEKIAERIKRGEGIANSLRSSAYFPPFVVEMVAIGEKSGSLDEMLQSVSSYYDLEVSEAVKNMTSLIEPIVTVVLGGMVLILMLAIFLPMWDMMSIIQ